MMNELIDDQINITNMHESLQRREKAIEQDRYWAQKKIRAIEKKIWLRKKFEKQQAERESDDEVPFLLKLKEHPKRPRVSRTRSDIENMLFMN